jgi:hypothetical protein
MSSKSRQNAPFPQREFEDRLSKLLADAMTAGLSASQLEGALLCSVADMQARQAAQLNLSTIPITYDGHGKVRVS